MAVAVFWIGLSLTLFIYAGYPLVMLALASMARFRSGRLKAADELPTVTMIIPVHNERRHIAAKLENLVALSYPTDRLETFFVSDGSTDGTAAAIKSAGLTNVQVRELPTRRGKAAALNAGLELATHDIIVFTDASIMLEHDALLNIVRQFRDPGIGCVSGEDSIPAGGGEGLYGKYELFIRRQESEVHSIVGASGSFYAQRRMLCAPFLPTLAPDFLSVLRTVEQGFRATSEPTAKGEMASVARNADEFQRKVRTLLRGMTTLGRYPHLLNPFAYGVFAFELLAHKIGRWIVPLLLVAMFASNGLLAMTSAWWKAVLVLQVAFYLCAILGLARTTRGVAARFLPVKIATYFTLSNAAVLIAIVKYFAGVRQEIWSPSQRVASNSASIHG